MQRDNVDKFCAIKEIKINVHFTAHVVCRGTGPAGGGEQVQPVWHNQAGGHTWNHGQGRANKNSLHVQTNALYDQLKSQPKEKIIL